MTNKIMQKAVSGLRYIIDGEEFEGKKEIMTIVLMCIEGHICPEVNVQGFFKKSIAERKPIAELGKTEPEIIGRANYEKKD